MNGLNGLDVKFSALHVTQVKDWTDLTRFMFVRPAVYAFFLVLSFAVVAPMAHAQMGLATAGLRLAVAEAAARDEDLAAFYRDRSFEGVWTGSSQMAQARRNALLTALSQAESHGIPASRYDVQTLVEALFAADDPVKQGHLDVELSRLLLLYARDVNTGLLNPGEVVPLIKRDVPLLDRRAILEGFLSAPSPSGYLRQLAPQAPEYTRLMRNYLEMQAMVPLGGWGPVVSGGRLEPGDSGPRVVELRNRLMAMGYLGRSVTVTLDDAIRGAVERFQSAHGLTVDGIAGEATLRQINVPLETRMQSVLVAMERERWMNIPRGDRHIWVNLTDFHANIVDFDRVTFSTRSVIGALDSDRQSPEFSDVMTHMVVNPSWHVPRSIIVSEYLPSLQSNPSAVGHLEIIDRQGRVISRDGVDFSQFSATSFPFSMRQPPGARNALGLVKFMFPNPYNIYLHDTPAQDLFSREVRAFSHGCIRLDDPFDFAYALLARQSSDPVGFFQQILDSGDETRVDLEKPLPVHLVYRTAFTSVTGELQFRADIYGRDALIWDALSREGVVVGGVQG